MRNHERAVKVLFALTFFGVWSIVTDLGIQKPSVKLNFQNSISLQTNTDDDDDDDDDNFSFPPTFSVYETNFTSTKKQKYQTKPTVALIFPCGLIGGYRNQVLRFIAFVEYAQKHNIQQMLLPSMMWTTTYKTQKRRFLPIPMHLLFDIDYWNSFSESGHSLPILVEELKDADCWKSTTTTTSSLHTYQKSTFNTNVTTTTAQNHLFPLAPLFFEQEPFLTPLINISKAFVEGTFLMVRQEKDFFPQVSHCKHPIAYGGGTGAGRLWIAYKQISQSLRISGQPNKKYLARHNKTNTLLGLVSNALRPSPHWRQVAEQCVISHQQDKMQRQEQENDKVAVPPFAALHTRVEMDMINHRCSKNMEKNLTKIYQMVDTFIENYNKEQREDQKISGVFQAVSKNGLTGGIHEKDPGTQATGIENFQTFVSRVESKYYGDMSKNDNYNINHTSSSWTNLPPWRYFTCGELWMDVWYDVILKRQNQTKNMDPRDYIERDHFGSIVASMLNFHIATQAAVFIGVAKSSWSTEVWTARYYQGKGSTNFEYLTNGTIVPLSNTGRPPLDKLC